MAILSGCDYLPKIPGIGLGTACTLLKKWKTAEQVVRAITLEGILPVPPDYWKRFQLVEKCFLHQRVYCPTQEKLVYLTEVTGEWNDTYVGRYGNLFFKHIYGLADEINSVTWTLYWRSR